MVFCLISDLKTPSFLSAVAQVAVKDKLFSGGLCHFSSLQCKYSCVSLRCHFTVDKTSSVINNLCECYKTE